MYFGFHFLSLLGLKPQNVTQTSRAGYNVCLTVVIISFQYLCGLQLTQQPLSLPFPLLPFCCSERKCPPSEKIENFVECFFLFLPAPICVNK